MSQQHSGYTTALGIESEEDEILDLSARVQAAITASGSLQEIGPLEPSIVLQALKERRCWVLKDEDLALIGCAFMKELQAEWYHRNDDFDIHTFPRPWLFLHWIMLEPSFQGRGAGIPFFREVVRDVQALGGTVLLDCWAGSTKLRDFYRRAGCRYVATLPEDDYEIAVFVWPSKA